MVVNLNGSTQSLLQAGQNRKNVQSAFTQTNAISFKSTEGQNSDTDKLADNYKEQLATLNTKKTKFDLPKNLWEGIVQPLQDGLTFLKEKPITFGASALVLWAACKKLPILATAIFSVVAAWGTKEAVSGALDARKAYNAGDMDTANTEVKRFGYGLSTAAVSSIPVASGIKGLINTHKAINLAATEGVSVPTAAKTAATAETNVTAAVTEATAASGEAAKTAATTNVKVNLSKLQKMLAYMQFRTNPNELLQISKLNNPDVTLTFLEENPPAGLVNKPPEVNPTSKSDPFMKIIRQVVDFWRNPSEYIETFSKNWLGKAVPTLEKEDELTR